VHVGAVAFIHRFGFRLNELVHFHFCAVDGDFDEVENLHGQNTGLSMILHPASEWMRKLRAKRRKRCANALPALRQYFAPDCECHVFHPINGLRGIAEINAKFWQPLLQAMPNFERRTRLFFAGDFDGRFCGGDGTWVIAHGYLLGAGRGDAVAQLSY
jgi:hypothetical protein